MGKVVVFGSFVVDLMARTPHLPKPAETVKGSFFRMGAGGKGFNQAVAARKSGADVTMITKVGKDPFADVLFQVMDDLEMDRSHIFISEDTGTGIAIITVDENSGQNEIVIVSQACGTIRSEEVDKASGVLQEAEYVLLQLEVNQDANEKVAALVKEAGARLIINTAPYSPVSDEFLRGAYLVTPNEVEAEQLTGVPVTDAASASKAAAWFRAKGVENVIITMGALGAFVATDDGETLVPAYRVKAIDTTGAGDAFNGGLLAALAEGKDLMEAAQFASAVGALSVQKLGTTPAMPDREEVDAFLADQAQ